MSAGHQLTVARAPTTVLGYHGCSPEVAEAVLHGAPLIPSANRMDWLGHGVYFWEYAPYRALEWARSRYAEPAVLEAAINLGDCLNLLDREHFEALEKVYRAVAKSLVQKGLVIPRNTERGAHFLDREVIDTYCQITAEVTTPFQTVRGCFPEGEAIYQGSKILSKAHVQIAVRDAVCISWVRRVELEDELGVDWRA